MSEGDRQEAANETRRVTYCVIPLELAGTLHDPLRRHFQADPAIEVLVDRRRHERRARQERRGEVAGARAAKSADTEGRASAGGKAATADDAAVEGGRGGAEAEAGTGVEAAGARAEAEAPGGTAGDRADRRAIRNPGGRRVGDRRAAAVPLAESERPPLPRRARRFAERIAFYEGVRPGTEEAEDLDTARMVIRYQSGDAAAFQVLYERYFDRVYSYFRLMLRDTHEAEDATQDVFENLMGALRSYERTDRPFRAWLFTVVRNHAIRLLRRSSRFDVVDSASLDEQRENGEPAAEELRVLEWISETDLLILVERLPSDQRQVLAMRYVLDLKPSEIAAILGISANHASVLHYRAINFLRERLERLGRTPTRRGNRARMRAFPKQAQVLRRRRFVLDP